MSIDRKKLNLIVFLIVQTILLSGCFLDLKRAVEIASDNQEQLPIRELTITIDPSQRQDLFEQLRRFADKYAFEFHLDFYDPDKEVFLVSMYRDDLKILVDHAPNDPTIISIDFYERNPDNPVPEETIDELLNDLKTFIGEIPNVTITQEN